MRASGVRTLQNALSPPKTTLRPHQSRRGVSLQAKDLVALFADVVFSLILTRCYHIYFDSLPCIFALRRYIMRLLNARSYEFEEFFDNQVPAYAILSHTWRDKEVLFKDFQPALTVPRNKPGWAKIQNTCTTALCDGLRWVWIDTCCIDKGSSAELSEAINSMFKWYKNATVCYAFLDDVPAGCEIASEKSSFANARWFRRGWTLQELIAPSEVIFYVKNPT